MGIIIEMFIIFNIIFLCRTAFAESTKCDCDIYQIYFFEDENVARNFTKQTTEVKGRPIYHSFTNTIFWNEVKKSWMGHEGKLKSFKLKQNLKYIYVYCYPFPTIILSFCSFPQSSGMVMSIRTNGDFLLH